MKLLITTQAVDRDDPILGFFHGWLAEFAKHFEHISVICLREGTHALPKNVSVYSLGKESGENYIKYILRFYTYVWKLRNSYDVVFSHMNPHYIVLAGWFWSLCKKPIFFWRNHAKMNLMTRIAVHFAKRVFYTSPFACTRIFPHSVQMPVGIDTNIFTPQKNVQRNEHAVLFLGRISQVKRAEIFVNASKHIAGVSMHVYGDESKGQIEYRKNLEQIGEGHVTFHGGVPNYETPAIYSAFGTYVNLTPEGSMDKTVLEAAACGALVIVANESFRGVFPDVYLLKENTPESLVRHIQKFDEMPQDEKREYRVEARRIIERDHSLQKLATELTVYFST